MFRFRLGIPTFAGVIAVSMTAVSLAQAPQFLLRDLGTLGGPNSRALGMNDHGVVVGWSQVAPLPGDGATSAFSASAFIWQDGVMANLETLGGAYAEARAVNNANQVVGWSFDPNGEQRAFYAYDGVMFDLNALLDVQLPVDLGAANAPAVNGTGCRAPLRRLVEANYISDDGLIVACGLLAGQDSMHGFVLRPEDHFDPCEPGFIVEDLGELEGADDCIAHCVNMRGQVVGVSGDRGFIWEKGEIRTIETFTRLVILESEARAVSNGGTAVGWCDETGWAPQACIWRNGRRLDLTTAPAWVSAANDVNEHHQVVGWAVAWDALPGAMLWNGRSESVELTDETYMPLIGSGAGFPWSRLEEATAIDERGRIVGYGRGTDGRERAFMLQPARPGRIPIPNH